MAKPAPNVSQRPARPARTRSRRARLARRRAFLSGFPRASPRTAFTHALHRAGMPIVPRWLSHVARFFTGIEIHPAAKIGNGVFIDHGMGVVIRRDRGSRRRLHDLSRRNARRHEPFARQTAPDARQERHGRRERVRAGRDLRRRQRQGRRRLGRRARRARRMRRSSAFPRTSLRKTASPIRRCRIGRTSTCPIRTPTRITQLQRCDRPISSSALRELEHEQAKKKRGRWVI